MRPEQCQASYAMAENVFAVTQTPLGRIPATFSRRTVEGTSLDEKQTSFNLVDGRFSVSHGRTLTDTVVRIRRGSGDLCDDAVAGAIELRGESLFAVIGATVDFSANR